MTETDGSAPFRLEPEATRPDTCRPLILDPEEYHAESETRSEKYRRLYKTTDRRIYDTAGERAGKTILRPEEGNAEIHSQNSSRNRPSGGTLAYSNTPVGISHIERGSSIPSIR